MVSFLLQAIPLSARYRLPPLFSAASSAFGVPIGLSAVTSACTWIEAFRFDSIVPSALP